MIIYYKELNGEPSTYEPLENKDAPLIHIIQDFANSEISIITFYINEKTKIFLNKDFILQIEKGA